MTIQIMISYLINVNLKSSICLVKLVWLILSFQLDLILIASYSKKKISESTSP